MLWLKLKNWLRRDKGQDLTEYALLIGLIVLLAIIAVAIAGEAVAEIFSKIASALQSAAGVVP